MQPDANLVPELSFLLWGLIGVTIIIAVIGFTVFRKSAFGAAVMTRLSQRFATSDLGTYLGFPGPPEGRRYIEQLSEACRSAVAPDFALYLENDIQPSGCIILVIPADAAIWVQEHHPLTLRILHTVIQKAQDDAYVEANSRRYPAGGRDHRRTVRATAETSAPRPKVSIRFLPSYDDQCSAVFAGSVESATRLAYRRFATSIPAGNQALEVPTIAPDLELGRDQLGFESISDIESFLSEPSAQNLIPKTESYHAAMAPTESATSLATEPYTPVSAILDSPGVLAGAAGSTAVLRMGSALTIGRAPGNDLVATDDLSVSGTHLRVTLRVGCVEIEASGKTGTWVTTHRGQQHIRAGGVESIPLPATITLGDARKTILRISETRIPAE